MVVIGVIILQMTGRPTYRIIMVKKMTTKEEFESDWLIAYRVSVNAWLDMFQQTIQFQRDIFNFFMNKLSVSSSARIGMSPNVLL